ncbi:imidazole glycerol phosphate synthase subunit HisH [Micrococcoides hystricis]|uniref:Imidazole glycerol phosphate synthase subunit HisH n=1 Tax=Micrococcoides hystricis TaxID=1572761 RepID=A0ABV6P8J7_9MICC
MGRPEVVVLDYGAGNIHSAMNALRHVGANVELSRDSKAILNADGLLVPGVGAFGTVMEDLRASGAPRWIGQRIAGNRPVMGICVGHQVFFERGVEHGVQAEGLGEWPGVVEQLDAPMLPHIGWDFVCPPAESDMFEGVANERFYFVHSYAVQKWDFEVGNPKIKPPQVTWAHHGVDFIAAIENGPLWSTQFHPEKSGRAGLQLLRNWVETL